MSLLRHLSGLLFVFILCHLAKGQYTPGVLFTEERSFNDSLADILHAAALDAVYDAGEDGPLPVSFVVIDLNRHRKS